ncbi:hypothetical protein [Yinghuangia soli]|uniref:Uncharacterized protein n=1 Tax=Yinghuangia soli TaxID=2908204 RepID=A0AA41Q4C9_9ACTN|nr:hypothetical protein [Yinghuangia soli]MCF2531323.1 hypothetical protein [Yinghuangia soli]
MIFGTDFEDAPRVPTLGGWLADSARELWHGDGFTTQCRDWLAGRPVRRTSVPVQSLGGWLATGSAYAARRSVPCCTDPDCPHLT